MEPITFEEMTSHINKRYFYGKMVRFLLSNHKGESAYCFRCGNISNAVIHGKLFWNTKYTIPVCNQHIEGRK